MKNLKYLLTSLLSVLLIITSCQDEDITFGDITTPSNIQIEIDIVGADTSNPNGDGSGVVNFVATADNATAYQFVYNNAVSSAPAGYKTYSFANLGLNTYTVSVIAFGTGGASSTEVIEVEVLSLYEPPAELITLLTGDSSRTFRIKSEAPSHFGLGAIDGDLNGFFAAPPNDKAGVGMYDDRYTFNIDGTFTHNVDGTNDDPVNDPTGTVFGRDGLIDQLNGSGSGTVNGADVENYPYQDYSEQWTLTAPGGTETINLTGIGFIGYYIGGDHTYEIEMRSANEMVLRATDGNGEFDWGFILIAE
ncbi:hypothetical protein [Lacinutrix sp. Hel_I_90]|uniref:hypothetical protein n=1 Tax=Lacinutrix sp. Hel_I_90 TaxID=1249999 RepID=UPI0005CB73E2|nr:hypothetical protein [Lacinutrix sp. Hel_I_90]